jgi:nucleotide-binding universal stress UspA family protein
MRSSEPRRAQRETSAVRNENQERLAEYDDAIRRYLGGVARAEERLRGARAGTAQRSVVVGVKAAGSFAAVDEAVTEATLRGWPLRIVHVQPRRRPTLTTEGRPTVASLLEEAYGRARAQAPDTVIEVERLFGPIAQTLAGQSAAGLLVLGSRSSGTLADLVTGSLVADVLAEATGPVGLVRTPIAFAETGRPRPVLVGVDGSPAAQAAVVFAADEARRRNAPLLVMHVVANAPARSSARSADPLWTGPLRAEAEDLSGLTVLRCREEGSVPQVLIEASATAAILVVGKAAGHHFGHGSLSQALTRNATCPLFIVRAAVAQPVAL